jgi:BirA family biotin operon repressor/biotin-[acetyl-CoA-carboxylase] ligase
MNTALSGTRARSRPGWPAGLQVEFVQDIDSTNRALLDARFGPQPQPPRLLAAREQTAGRGRRGRSWLAEPGRSLAFSLATEHLAAPLVPSVALAVGVALAEALAPLAGPLTLKWPNDLLRLGAKCGGILVESRRGGPPEMRIDRCVVGVGLNLLAPRDPQGLIQQPVQGLFDEGQPLPEEASLLAIAAAAMLGALAEHRACGFEPFVSRFDRLHAWAGQAVRAIDDGRLLAEGVVAGVAQDGALRLTGAHGELRLIAGELSLRRGPDTPERK